ncbi:MAG: hypothetical protein ACM3NZ_09980 [Betaproteobacteria bacterium]
MESTGRRISYFFLCALPFVNIVVVGMRSLRIPGLYSAVGGLLFATIVIAAWTLGMRVIAVAEAETRSMALAGSLLIAPWAIVSLLWVGLGAPFQATTAENYMRFLVLLGSSIVVAGAFLALKQALYDAGERFYSTLGFAASIPAGVAYLLSVSVSVAQSMAKLGGHDATASPLLFNLYSVLEFVAVILTYMSTAAFAASLGHAGWLGRRAAYMYVVLNIVFVVLLLTRGLAYPELSGNTAPWYMRPGFIVGIPAVPWIMPGLLGVVLLRRAGAQKPSG